MLVKIFVPMAVAKDFLTWVENEASAGYYVHNPRLVVPHHHGSEHTPIHYFDFSAGANKDGSYPTKARCGSRRTHGDSWAYTSCGGNWVRVYDAPAPCGRVLAVAGGRRDGLTGLLHNLCATHIPGKWDNDAGRFTTPPRWEYSPLVGWEYIESFSRDIAPWEKDPKPMGKEAWASGWWKAQGVDPYVFHEPHEALGKFDGTPSPMALNELRELGKLKPGTTAFRRKAEYVKRVLGFREGVLKGF